MPQQRHIRHQDLEQYEQNPSIPAKHLYLDSFAKKQQQGILGLLESKMTHHFAGTLKRPKML
jgi:hypothetical protein